MLAESHLSIHTWPETGVAKCDIFTCGDKCLPEKAVEYMKEAFKATEVTSQEHERI
jgi:S-adenosylmethionine decarboxylase